MNANDLRHFRGLRGGNSRWTAFCPCCEYDKTDGDRHLSVSEGNNGRLLLHCFHGCLFRDILNAAGLPGNNGFGAGRCVAQPKPQRAAKGCAYPSIEDAAASLAREVGGTLAARSEYTESFIVLRFNLPGVDKHVLAHREAAGRQLAGRISRIPDAESDGKLRAALRELAARAEKQQAIRATLFLAQPRLAVMPDLFDADPWLFNVRNGTLDLRTGKLRPHDRDDFITKMADVDFGPDAAAPRWDKLLYEIFDDEQMIQYVVTVLGYCLSGDNTLPDGRKEESDAEGRHVRFIPGSERLGKVRSDIVRLIPGEPARIEVVRLIFDLCCRGNGPRNTVIELNRRGDSQFDRRPVVALPGQADPHRPVLSRESGVQPQHTGEDSRHRPRRQALRQEGRDALAPQRAGPLDGR